MVGHKLTERKTPIYFSTYMVADALYKLCPLFSLLKGLFKGVETDA